MKLLIAYDGSIGAEAALDDLPNAGLPAAAEALVISVAEVWLPPPPENETLSEYAQALQTHPQFFKAHIRTPRPSQKRKLSPAKRNNVSANIFRAGR